MRGLARQRTHDIMPYSEIYSTIHPSRLQAYKNHWQCIAERADVLTGKLTTALIQRCSDNNARRLPNSHNRKVRMSVLPNLDVVTMQQRRSDAPAPGTDSYTDPATQAVSDPSATIEARPTSLICATGTKPVAKPAAKRRSGA